VPTLKKGRYDRFLISVDGFPVAWSSSLSAALRQARTLAEGGLSGVSGLLPIEFDRVVVTDTWKEGKIVATFDVCGEQQSSRCGV
jgi:hypothetical protein